MASHVEVILREDVDNLGHAGDMVRVKPGYARNYLLPRRLAVAATRSNVKQIEHEKRIADALAAKVRKQSEGLAAQVEGLSVEVAMQVGEDDKLFGSVTSRDVVDALARQGIVIDRKKLQLGEQIKTLGEHQVTAKFGRDVTASFTVIVTRA